ncbi:MAG TPA: ABC transporter ATP-binding protein [bacterium]|nr:ABC transporter ATP-binding protein [bacterium]
MKKIFRAIKMAKKFWPTFLMLAISILIISVGKQVPPLVSKEVVDSLQLSTAEGIDVEQGLKVMFPYLAIYLGSLVILSAANRFSFHHSRMLNVKLRKHYTEIGFKKLLGSDIGYFDNNVSGSLMSKLERGVGRLTGQVTNIAVFFLPNIVSSIIALVILYNIRPEIVGVIFLVIVPYVLINLRILKKHEPIEKKIHKIWDKEMGHFYEVLSSMRLVKSFNRKEQEESSITRVHNKLVDLNKKIEKLWDWSLSKDILIEFMTWGLFLYSIVLVLNNQVTLGTFFLIIQYLALLKEPFLQVSWIYFEVRRTMIGARAYFKILDSKIKVKDSINPIELEEVKGKIEFDNVTFSYPKKGTKGAEKVLDRMDLSILPGETVALVAKSGGGKTTIANLINRFYDIQSGKILIDGHDIRALRQEQLRDNIGLVLQDSYLFQQTVEENLKYGNSKATEKELIAAAKSANAWEFIKSFPKKLKTEIGERGVKLSGGQKQRLSIARTLLKDPPILILDEATSSLDSESELRVQAAIWELIEGRTAIIIAHRLSTIQRADRILVIEKGKVVEEGSHSELMKKAGIYAGLYNIQTGKKKLKEFEIVA